MMASALFFPVRTAMTIHGLYWFHINFRILFFYFFEKCYWGFVFLFMATPCSFGILVPQPRVGPGPSVVTVWILTTGPLGNTSYCGVLIDIISHLQMALGRMNILIILTLLINEHEITFYSCLLSSFMNVLQFCRLDFFHFFGQFYP